MRVEISGAVQLRGEWQGYGEFRDLLASDTGDVSLMAGQNPQPSGGDSSFTLRFPGKLGAGQFAIGRFVPGVASATPAAFVIFDSTFYASIPGGTVRVDTANYPLRPGLVPGVLYGTLTFRAVRLVADPGGAPIETADTITVRATFAARWYHYLRPNVSVTLSGAGPVNGTSIFSTAQSLDDDHGGRFVEWESDFVPPLLFPHAVSQELRIFAPGVGVFPVLATTPSQFGHPSAWPAVYTALFFRDDPRLGLSTGGTLTITRYVTPTDEFYGEIQGTLATPMALWSDSTTVTADTVNATVTFAVQLWPLGGIPASARAMP